MNTRLISEVRKLSFVVILGVLYYIFVSVTGIYIPCVFREVTGLKCPGCGISHMLVAILKFDFVAAFKHNCMLFVMLPFASVLFFLSEYRYVKYGTRGFRGCRAFMYIAATALVLFGIIRNI